MGRKYQKAPLTEALAEFQFGQGTAWDLTVPGEVYQELRSSFPRKRQAKHVNLGVAQTDAGIAQRVQTVDRMMFLAEDEKSFVQLSPNLVAINHLSVYPGWSGFRPMIEQGFDAYCKVVEPATLDRVVLRYINRFTLDKPITELSSFLSFYPNLPGGQRREFESFIVGAQFQYEQGRDMLKVLLVQEDHESSEPQLMLDLEYATAKAGVVGLSDAVSWVETAHERIEQAFEDCITDALREQFGEESD